VPHKSGFKSADRKVQQRFHTQIVLTHSQEEQKSLFLAQCSHYNNKFSHKNKIPGTFESYQDFGEVEVDHSVVHFFECIFATSN
jgi:hypothetical protein